MDVFLAEVGRRVAEKWLSLLTLPGLLLVTAATVGHTLGHRGWADIGELVDTGRRHAADLSRAGALTTVLVAVTMVLLATGAGLAATAGGHAVRRLWLAEGQYPLGGFLIGRRRARWRTAHEAYAARSEAADRQDARALGELDRLAALRNRICLAEPSRPTWIGDRLAAMDTRVHSAYALDLGTAWPRLWLTVPEETRAEVRLAATAFDTTARLAGWGLMYVLLGLSWWPAAVGGVAVWFTAWRRGRAAVAVYADLVESVVDLHAHPLAQALGFTDEPGPMTSDLGAVVTSAIRKGA